MDLHDAKAYILTHPDWEGSTVALAVDELRDLTRDVNALRWRFAGLNSFVNFNPALDKAIDTLEDELRERIDYWVEPLVEEKQSAS